MIADTIKTVATGATGLVANNVIPEALPNGDHPVVDVIKIITNIVIAIGTLVSIFKKKKQK